MEIRRQLNVRQEIELLRVVSAFGIVWTHSPVWGHTVAYAALPCFIMVSVFLAGEGGRPARAGAFLRRLRDLGLPWLCWFLVFGCINLLRHLPFLPPRANLLAAILSGTHIHLWYIPFMILVSGGVDLLVARTTPLQRGRLGAITAFALLASSTAWMGWAREAGEPWTQYAQASVAVMAGLFLQGFALLGRWEQIAYTAGLVCASLMTLDVVGIGLPYSICIPVMLWVLFAAPSWMRSHDYRGWAALTFGIYLVHPPFIWLQTKYQIADGLWIPIIAFSGSALLVIALQRLLPPWLAVAVAAARPTRSRA